MTFPIVNTGSFRAISSAPDVTGRPVPHAALTTPATGRTARATKQKRHHAHADAADARHRADASAGPIARPARPPPPHAPHPSDPDPKFPSISAPPPRPAIAMADCRSLIEFLRAFEQHRRRASPSDPSSPRPRRASLSSSSSRPRGRGRLFPALCDHSPLAVVDALALLASLAALAFLAAPYARLLAAEARDAVAAAATRHPAAPCVPLAAGVAAGAAVLAWDAAAHRARRCGRPRCRGLRKAVEYDIQLETEECVRGLPHAGGGVAAAAPARPASEIGDDHRELEAVLRKMAPPNGRTVLIFRAPCGCPKERMEVWGAKKVRRIKK
uniref:Ribosomal protein L34e superfamily protein n=2 Tax=Setaria viridis TaxID=4556 RepID=A0A4U6VBK7_SETVI|nr:hypothetical protein SEVIR_3G204000v2 [Setaria viridis]